MQTVVVLDNAWAGGRHVEEAKDFYAQDRDMPATPVPGFACEQEHSPVDEAMDVGEIMALDGLLSGPTGTYTDVLTVFESSSIDP